LFHARKIFHPFQAQEHPFQAQEHLRILLQ
jgi:hypothetical protein